MHKVYIFRYKPENIIKVAKCKFKVNFKFKYCRHHNICQYFFSYFDFTVVLFQVCPGRWERYDIANIWSPQDEAIQTICIDWT